MVSTTRPTLVNTDSVDEIARRSRGAANAPLEGREARLEKSTISCQAGRDGVLFFRKAHKPGSRFSRATRDQDFGLRQRGMTRNCPGGASEWRRTPRPHPEEGSEASRLEGWSSSSPRLRALDRPSRPFASGKGRLSDCVGGQAVSGRHGCLSRRMALRMVRSLRAAAMATSILGLPASMRRWRKALRTGL